VAFSDRLRGLFERQPLYGAYYGLYPSLRAYPTLAFLSAGLLIASYTASNDRTVYVYKASLSQSRVNVASGNWFFGVAERVRMKVAE